MAKVTVTRLDASLPGPPCNSETVLRLDPARLPRLAKSDAAASDLVQTVSMAGKGGTTGGRVKQSTCIRLRGSGPGDPRENSEDAMLDEIDDEEACAALLHAEQQHMEGDHTSGADAQPAAALTASPRRQAGKRMMELSPREHRAQDGKLARRQLADGRELAGLQLRQVTTSPYNYNCLAFSCLMAAGQIAPTLSAQEDARHRSDLERACTRMKKLCGSSPQRRTRVCQEMLTGGRDRRPKI